MKATFVISCILAVALLGLSCTPETTLSVSVTEVDGGIMIENLSTVACIVFVRSPEGEQWFELAANESVTATDISQPIEVSAVSVGSG